MSLDIDAERHQSSGPTMAATFPSEPPALPVGFPEDRGLYRLYCLRTARARLREARAARTKIAAAIDDGHMRRAHVQTIAYHGAIASVRRWHSNAHWFGRRAA